MIDLSKLLGIQPKKKSRAPQWFCKEMEKGTTELEIREHIHTELVREIEHFDYDRRLWTDDYTRKVAGLYYGMFEQLYMESA